MPKSENETVDKNLDARTSSEEHVSKAEDISDTKVVYRSNTPLMIALLVMTSLLFVAAIATITGNIFIRNHSGFMFGRNNNTVQVQRRGSDFSGTRSGMMGHSFWRSNY